MLLEREEKCPQERHGLPTQNVGISHSLCTLRHLVHTTMKEVGFLSFRALTPTVKQALLYEKNTTKPEKKGLGEGKTSSKEKPQAPSQPSCINTVNPEVPNQPVSPLQRREESQRVFLEAFVMKCNWFGPSVRSIGMKKGDPGSFQRTECGSPP